MKPGRWHDPANKLSPQQALHMAGTCPVEGLRELGAERIAVDNVYCWPDWRDGIVRFLRDAGFEVLWHGNFVDQGFHDDQRTVNDLPRIFEGDLAELSMLRVAEAAPAVPVPGWRVGTVRVRVAPSPAVSGSVRAPASRRGWHFAEWHQRGSEEIDGQEDQGRQAAGHPAR